MDSRSSARGSSSSRGRRVAPDTAGVDLVYGRNVVREALRGQRRVHCVLLADARQSEDEGARGALMDGLGSSEDALPPVKRISIEELSTRLGTTDHQGIAAEVDPYPYADEKKLFEGFTLLVALHEVQDPHNLGAIIRTAEAAGAGVIISRHRAVEVTAAVAKASAGATEHASVARVRNLSDSLAAAKERGFWVYGASVGVGQDYDREDYSLPACFVLGSEGKGLGRRVTSLCDVMVGLPMAGKVDSLNVSVSAGVLLYEAVRQRKQRPESLLKGDSGQKVDAEA